MPRSPMTRPHELARDRKRARHRGIIATLTVSAIALGAAAIPAASASAADTASGFTTAQLQAAYDSDSWPSSDYSVKLLSGFTAANASATTTAENEAKVEQINKTASSTDAAAAITDANTNSADAIADGLGSTISTIYTKALAAGELPKTKSLLQGGRVAQGIGSTDTAKAHYGNPRPFLRLSGLKEWTDWSGLAGQGSYPSGHTTSAYTNGTVLATLLPELAPQILARASEYGQHRIVLGVHYPLDVMGGRMLGQAVVAARWNDPSFRVLLEQARTELRDLIASKCGMSVSACVASETPYRSTSDSLSVYKDRLDYGFTAIGSTKAAAEVPDSAAALLLTTFPNLTDAQRRDVIAATETASGEPLDTATVDNGSWERVDLAAAMTAKVTQHADGTLTVNGTTFPATNAKAPTVDTLQQNGQLQQRWLSTPSSRLVMNPLDYAQNKTEVQTDNDGSLPLGVSYYAADSDNRRADVLGIYDHLPASTSSDSGSSGGASTSVFQDTFDSLDSGWSTIYNVTPSVSDSKLTLTNPASSSKSWGGVQHTVTDDLDTNPILTVKVPDVDGKWSLKVNNGGSDVTVQSDTDQTGTFTYDVKKRTGWSGVVTFTLKLNVAGTGSTATYDSVAFGPQTSSLAKATTSSTQWRADSLPFTAAYGSGGSVTGRDLFHDQSSLTRSITTSGFSASTPTLTGAVSGTVSYDADTNQVTVVSDTWSTVIDLDNATNVKFYTSESDLLGAANGTSAPSERTAYWSADLPKSGTTTIGLGYATAAEGTPVAATRSAAAADGSTVSAAVAQWTSYWNAVLARVPVAQRYDLPDVDTNGVASGDVEQSYYRAWIMLEENVLPVMSETGYDSPQVATGKASGWMKGPDGMKPSASWDSLLGMQYLAYIDPATAVSAYKGMMSMMSSSGQIGGESLPSIKAKTGWDIYQITGDKTVLTDTYDHLTQYLTWAEKNPRWILSTSHDIADEKDSQFVASLLVDLGFAERIATTLGHPQQATTWKADQATLASDFTTWFVDTATSTVEQYHYTSGSQADDAGTRSVVTGALHAPGLDSATRKALLDDFTANFNESSALGGLNGVGTNALKAPDAQLTALGLLDQGAVKQARDWVETVLRDVVGTGQFSETYVTPTADTTAAQGVRPSVFGAVNTIDFVWMRNGVRSDQGNPSAVNLTDSDGGVSGLTWMGKRYSVTTTAGGVASFAGDAVGGLRCHSVTLPSGATYTADIDTPRCVSTGGAGASTGSGGHGTGGASGSGSGSGASGSVTVPASTALGRISIIGINTRQHTVTARLGKTSANSSIDFVVHSSPRDLGTYRLDSNSSVTLRLPSDLPGGSHTLVAFRNGHEIATGRFSWPLTSALAFTGGNLVPWSIALAVIAVLAGAVVRVARRRGPVHN